MDIEPVWVIDAPDLQLDRSERMADKLGRRGAEVQAIGSRWCVSLPADLDRVRWKRRVERRLDRPIEERADCDVAWFPLGRGYAAVFLDGPADDLEGFLDDASLSYREVRRPLTGDDPVRLCVPIGALPSTVDFAEDLRTAGYGLRGMFEVGGCHR